MSWNEYTDMFEQTQKKKSDLLMVVFDVVDSRTISYDAEKIIQAINMTILHLKENNENTVIVPNITNEFSFWKQGDMFFQKGDLFGIVINPHLTTVKEVVEEFLKNKMKLNIQNDFHIASGYFETFDWTQGNTLYYYGYCVDELEHRTK